MGIGAAILGAGALAGGAALGSGIIQGNAANKATNTQLGIYQQNQALLNPYVQQGLGAYNTLNSLLGVGAAPGSSMASSASPTMTWANGQSAAPGATNLINGLYQNAGVIPANIIAGAGGGGIGSMQAALENLPGYQFTLNQGLKSTQNSYAARGLADSGGALKGAANYATGLANSGWNTYANALQNSANTGYGAGAAIAGVGSNTGQAVAGSQIAAGNAYAGGLSGAANSIGNALPLYALLNANNSATSLTGQASGPEFGYT